MLDYDLEAARYDDTRGGLPRAEAAAAAVCGLLPAGTRLLLDIGCGTGLVGGLLADRGLRVVGMDASPGMARVAATRLAEQVVLGDGRRPPFAAGSVDALSAVWLLHLLPDASAVIAQVARLLRPGGVFVTTVDKHAAHYVGSDIDAVLAPHSSRTQPFDRADLVAEHGARHGLRVAGESSFTGYGQGRTPTRAAAEVQSVRFPWARDLSEAQRDELARRLRALPGPEVRRADPTYRLLALRKA